MNPSLSLETFFVIGSILLILGVFASKVSSKLGIPALLLFLVIGMLAGSDGPGGLWFDDTRLSQTLGVSALVAILFSGGLDTNGKVAYKVLAPGLILSTVGVLITSGVMAWAACSLLGLKLWEGMLLGSIVASTDAAAVFAVLRSKHIGLNERVRGLLELESGSNDPMAIFLMMAILHIITLQSFSASHVLGMFFVQLLVGLIMGIGFGKLMGPLLNNIRLDNDSLYPIITIAMVILCYGLAHIFGGNGFLAVYLMGIILGNDNFIHKKSLILFHDTLAWLMQIIMFLVLGLLIYPSKIFHLGWKGFALSLILIFLARPIAVLLCLIGSKFNFREKVMISWVGLRGAAPVVLATYPLIQKIPHAQLIFDVVFFIVFTSVLIQGSSISFMARILDVQIPMAKKIRFPLRFLVTEQLKSHLDELEIDPHSTFVGKSILELELPKDILIVLIQRNNDVIVPRGSTVLNARDKVLVLAKNDELEKIKLKMCSNS